MMRLADFDSLITPIHRKYFTDNYYNAPEKQYTSIFKVEDMGKPSESKQHLGGFGHPLANVEGGTINVAEMSEGDSASYTSQRYDLGYIVTHELMTYSLDPEVFGGAGVAVNKNGEKKNVGNAPQLLGAGYAEFEEIEAAGVLTGGFDNTGYDGLALFSASHTLADSGETASNLISGALTPGKVKEGLSLMRSDSRSEANVKKVIRAEKLVVPEGLEWDADEIMFSQKQAHEFSNTKNSITKVEPVVNDFLTMNTDTNVATNWFLVSSQIENLLFAWLERPWFDCQIIPMKVDLFYFGYMHFTATYVNWRGLVGSTGA